MWHCARCGIPFEDAVLSAHLCGHCQHTPPPFSATLAAFRYASPISHLITGLKFHGHLEHARLLGLLLAQAVRERNPAPPEVLIPVPLNRARLLERGYNQALEIARVTGRELCIELAAHHCTRPRVTPPQLGLPAAERQRNVRGVFAVTRELPWRHVALVDDVMTTGATLSELTRLLLKAGVEQVDVWVVARTSG